MADNSTATVQLGVNGPVVGVQGLGCMGMSEFYGPADEAESRAVLEAALEAGVTLFDTADMYGYGANEEFLAPFVAAHRDEITVATKFGIVRSDDPSYRGFRGDREYVRQCVEGSLRRLGVDVIDLYYMHRRDPDTPIEETVGAMAELVTEGKVKHLGLSEVTGDELRAAAAVHQIAAIQSEWSLFSRDVEARVVPAAVVSGTAFVPYSPLGRGFIAGRFTDASKELDQTDFRGRHARFTGDNVQVNAELRETIREVADARGATLAQVALAWLQQRADVHGLSAVVPIPGTRRRNRLAENVAATRLRLTADELAVLEPIADKVAGRRYPAGGAGSSQDRE
ncbi:MAG: aldo/keto reductase [Stackebrandtia sp.]